MNEVYKKLAKLKEQKLYSEQILLLEGLDNLDYSLELALAKAYYNLAVFGDLDKNEVIDITILAKAIDILEKIN